MRILVCNSGSSSLRFSLFEADQELLLAEGSIDWTTPPTRLVFRRPGQPEIREELHLREHGEALGRILEDLHAGPSAPLDGIEDIDAVGHRVVHGGRRFTAAVRITAEVQSAIGELSELAPLHNPASLRCIQAIEQALPWVQQVAVFDTAFHTTLPAAAQTYAVPRTWRTDWGIHRYGFHGLTDARLALEVYIHRLVQTIGAMAAVLAGVDGLVFTAGVGENSAQVRELVCEDLGHLGLELDTTANARCQPDADIASHASPGRILVISTREDLTVVRETRRLIRSEAGTQGNVPRRQLTATTETV